MFAAVRSSRTFRIAALAAGIVLAGGAPAAFAQPHPHGGPGGGFGGPMMLAGPHAERILDSVGASTEQKAQIKAIVDAAQADLRAQHQNDRTLHEQMMAVFTQTTVDARAAETLRQQMLARHDAASKRMLQAMLDASRVLSAEQRQKLGQQFAQHAAMMERHRAEREAVDGKPPAR